MTAVALGLDQATLCSFPKLLYSRVKAASSSCCFICLSEHKESDVLRLLPGCGHYFRSKCVDLWLRMNRSRLNCRTSLVPTPVRSSLAEVTPPAGGRIAAQILESNKIHCKLIEVFRAWVRGVD
ncbi:hypothetical protein ACJRO7_003270 [Eucalyptus globulus]|uniref:RING-type domain-containing protein n=1 Tax=Eucalyptus globulus TaxID=34317 RepID=A0ABD3IVC2_EUCGL